MIVPENERLYVLVVQPGKVPEKRRAFGDTVGAWCELAKNLRRHHPESILIPVAVTEAGTLEIGSEQELLALGS